MYGTQERGRWKYWPIIKDCPYPAQRIERNNWLNWHYARVKPNGAKLMAARRRCAFANGIPMIVMAQSKANTKCSIAISHQPNIIHRTPKMMEKTPGLGFNSTDFPKGFKASAPSFISCSPKGMPIIVTHKINPAIKYIIATMNPPSRIQRILPIKLIFNAVSLY